ncbi:O-antigen ligase family protein [Rhodococcus indonesiensis]
MEMMRDRAVASSNVFEVLTVAGIVLTSFVAGAGATFWPALTVVVPLVFLGITQSAYSVVRGNLILAMVFALAPLPSIIPRGLTVASGYIFWVDVLLALAVLIVFAEVRSRRTLSAIVVTGLTLSLFLLYGLVNGAPLGNALADLRGPFRLAATTIVVWWLLRAEFERTYKVVARVVFAIIIWTAIVVALVSFAGTTAFPIRAASAALYTAGQSAVYDAIRVTPDSGLLCVMVSAALFACWLVRVETGFSIWVRAAIAGSGIFVGVMSFTRSYIIVFVIILAGAAFLSRARVEAFLRVVWLLAGSATILASLYLIGSLFSAGLHSLVSSVGDAFGGRVFGGLGTETLRGDSSTIWRLRENAWAWASFTSNWPLGTGFGVPYRGYQHGEIFAGGRGLLYVHSAYLWILVKAGVVGLIICVWSLASVVYLSLKRVSAVRPMVSRVFGLLLLGLAVQMVTSPTLFEAGNSVASGLLFGALLAISSGTGLSDYGEGNPGFDLAKVGAHR